MKLVVSQERRADVLKNWETVNSFLRDVAEKDEPLVWRLLDVEKAYQKRHTVMLRLYGKASRLRMLRERREIFSGM